MAKAPKTAIEPTREVNYPEWYQQVIKAADLAEASPVRGCMVIKPWGYAIWEGMQKVLDAAFKATGHENAYFPVFIPMSFLEKEAEHVEGFAKECAVVTHHRLEPGPKGGLVPAGPLEEPLVVRPTSETIIGAMYAKWVQSYRDLPILINQWCNVVRWELRTRLFLRTAEFLWQEGHTAHATEAEAREETQKMLGVYADFVENTMAVPVLRGEKTSGERFPGAVMTLSIEAMMQDRKALQAGTSHFLGQNFSRAQEIKFLDADGELKFAWTTSWGVSTRLIGALIMAHADDDGLVLPPKLAPKQVVILPVVRGDEGKTELLAYAEKLRAEIAAAMYDGQPVRVMVDTSDATGGEKKWKYVKKGVPVRIEVGARELEADAVFVATRTGGKPAAMPRAEFLDRLPAMLDEIQSGLFEKAKAFRAEHTREIADLAKFKSFFTPKDKDADTVEIHGGFAVSPFCECDAMESTLKDLKVTPRCIPLDQTPTEATCLFCNGPTDRVAVFAKAY